MVSICFDELIEVLTEKFREIVREEIRAVKVDENGMDKTKCLTVEETAKFLDCSIDHVYKLKGRIPVIKLGRRTYFKIEDLNAYLESGRTIPASFKRYA